MLKKFSLCFKENFTEFVKYRKLNKHLVNEKFFSYLNYKICDYFKVLNVFKAILDYNKNVNILKYIFAKQEVLLTFTYLLNKTKSMFFIIMSKDLIKH